MRSLTSALPGHRPRLLLELDLTELPVSPDPHDPLARLRARGRPQYRAVLRTLYLAAADARVAGLIAKVGGRLPWAAVQELRRGVEAFAASGKPTIGWAESFGEDGGDTPAYVLASAFGEVWLQPGGMLGLLGVGMETTFLRGVLDRLGVVPQIEQRFEYKNAADRLVRTDLTSAHRESLERLTASISEQAVATIAAARRLTPDRVRDLIDAGPHPASQAQAAGLVDRLGYRDEAYASLRSRSGKGQLLFADRWGPRRTPLDRLPRARRRVVGYVEIRGMISQGRSRRGPVGHQAGSDTVSAALRAAAADAAVRAVVIRVDSPGGSAVASETIWREVCRVRDAGKPVIVSMGALAASGGYYVSCPADVIVALPATLTGSIGVLGGKLVVRDLLQRAGVSTAEVAAGAHALMFSSRRPFDDDEQRRLAASLDAIYDDFVGKVAAGRRRPVADIEPIARGRVWTGADARDRGLVDELGGLQDALRIARARADLPDDAPLRPAVTVSPLARLGRPRNSEDPRAARVAAATTLGWPDLLAGLGVPSGPALLLPPYLFTGPAVGPQ